MHSVWPFIGDKSIILPACQWDNPSQSQVLKILRKKPLENNQGKGENAGNKHFFSIFSFFHNVFFHFAMIENHD